jgi:hypothetical protein
VCICVYSYLNHDRTLFIKWLCFVLLYEAASIRANNDLNIIKAKDQTPIVYIGSQGYLAIEGSHSTIKVIKKMGLISVERSSLRLHCSLMNKVRILIQSDASLFIYKTETSKECRRRNLPAYYISIFLHKISTTFKIIDGRSSWIQSPGFRPCLTRSWVSFMHHELSQPNLLGPIIMLVLYNALKRGTIFTVFHFSEYIQLHEIYK